MDCQWNVKFAPVFSCKIIPLYDTYDAFSLSRPHLPFILFLFFLSADFTLGFMSLICRCAGA